MKQASDLMHCIQVVYSASAKQSAQQCAMDRQGTLRLKCSASVWACYRFEKYVFGLHSFRPITITTPGTPHEHLRCQRLLMTLVRFDASAEYAPGKTLAMADALSRSPEQSCGVGVFHDDVAAHINAVMCHVATTPRRMGEIK